MKCIIESKGVVIMRFPELLKNERLKANLKQSELGARVGVGVATISLYEKGEREPKIDTLMALADVFNVSIDYLVGREAHDTKQENFEEEHLMQMFRALSDDNKEKVIAITKTLHDMDKKSCTEKIG